MGSQNRPLQILITFSPIVTRTDVGSDSPHTVLKSFCPWLYAACLARAPEKEGAVEIKCAVSARVSQNL